MRRLWLLRHGPTGAKGMCGWTDLPADLSDAAAINRLSLALPWVPVVSSDLRRAATTADAVAEDRPRLPHDPALRELHFGAWEMRTHAEAEAEDPILARALWEQPGEHAPPGGETWNALRARVESALDRHLAQHPELIVVCHFGPILAALQRARGIPALEAFAQRIEPLSLTVLSESDGAWRVEAVDHRP
ncbi:histidine phosphatase family protein [Rubellimicrobium aerolatum]|uniref:Histidine phosphatase family protein n=1 Tax=Rubellimicrobium aerolatum TaxID=490979 RepID=A0ABW0S8T1_9RHOB|nr:histidine phosphatase family protein [Rubellimicrobium aerolatum]MBP1804710.1 broad specificity phosphatase PhoE [Rubellimicrobium aerolatum]